MSPTHTEPDVNDTSEKDTEPSSGDLVFGLPGREGQTKYLPDGTMVTDYTGSRWVQFCEGDDRVDLILESYGRTLGKPFMRAIDIERSPGHAACSDGRISPEDNAFDDAE